MGKHKDLSEFDKGQIVMARRLIIPQRTCRSLVESMPRWVRAVLAAKGGQNSIRQVIIMLCLIGVYVNLTECFIKNPLCLRHTAVY